MRAPSSIVTDLAPARLREFFTREENRYRIRKSMRDRVLFAAHNLLRDPPFSHIDLISCRNLLIYLNRDIQMRVLEMFHCAFNSGGYLFLGGSESAESVDELFVAVDKKKRIYRARASVRTLPNRPQQSGQLTDTLHEARVVKLGVKPALSSSDIHQRALAHVAPPSAVLDADQNVVHMFEDAGQLMRVAGGEPFAGAAGTAADLRSALYQARHARDGVRREVQTTPWSRSSRRNCSARRTSCNRRSSMPKSEALEVLAQHDDVDVLVSDISMPEMDGYALLREARKLPPYAALPAIALSGLGREKDISAAREAGFAAHIGKPMSVERLAEVISELFPPQKRNT